MGVDLDRTSACARTMLGIFEPECRVPGLRQSAAALLRQIALAGLSGRVTAEALPRCFGGVRRAGSEHLTVQRASLPFGATLRGSPAGAGKGLRPFDPPLRPALGRRSRAAGSPVLVSWRRAKAAAAEVEHERTRQLARIGNNLNQIARWASWCSMKSGRKPSTSSRMVRAIARKPCGVIRSGGMSKARNVLSSQTCRLIIGDSGERVSMGQASGLPAGSLDRARTAHRLQSCSAIPATRPTAVRGRSPMNTSSTLSATWSILPRTMRHSRSMPA